MREKRLRTGECEKLPSQRRHLNEPPSRYGMEITARK